MLIPQMHTAHIFSSNVYHAQLSLKCLLHTPNPQMSAATTIPQLFSAHTCPSNIYHTHLFFKCLPPHRWEAGYWRTMDIAHDRAGFYLCWGCLNWIPAVYTSPSLYLSSHPFLLGNWKASAILLAGLTMVYVNYDADR